MAAGVAVTAHATATVVAEGLDVASDVAAVALDVHAIHDHDQPRFAIDHGVRWRWTDDAARERDAAIRAALLQLAGAG